MTKRPAFLNDGNVLQVRIPMPPKGENPYLPPDYKVRLEGATKYHGAIAEGYDAKREDSEKWKAEDRIMREILADIPRGASVLDCPVGTGRFLPLYEELGLNVLGLDISEDMLREAARKTVGDNTYLRLGDARETGLPARSYHVAVCCRLMRWLSKEDQLKVITEMQRVASCRVIFNVRTSTGPAPLSLAEIEAVVDTPKTWAITAAHQIVDDFTMFVISRTGGKWAGFDQATGRTVFLNKEETEEVLARDKFTQEERIDVPLTSTEKLGVKT